MKTLIKKILKEEFENLQWMMVDWIGGEQLRELLLQTGAHTIPFREVRGDLKLWGTPIKDLGNLQEVDGNLGLYETQIKDLGNLRSVGGSLDLEGTPIKDLGNLQSVGSDLNLYKTQIKSLGNLQEVGGWLDLSGTPFSKMHSEEEIRRIVRVEGDIYF